MLSNDAGGCVIDDVMGKEIEILTFPSHFSVAIEIKQALSDYTKPIEYIAEVIKKDPLITAKILQEASRRNVGGLRVINLAKAINILGFEHIKRIILVMVSKQIDQSKLTIRYASISRLIWLNTLYTGAAAHVLSNSLSSFDPEEALTCGLMLNIGAFYLLYQACVNPILRDDYDAVVDGIDQYYLSRTIDILTMFEMSSVAIHAVSIDRDDSIWPAKIKTLRDVVKIANNLSLAKFPWITSDVKDVENLDYADLLPEIDEMFMLMKNGEI